MAQTSDTLFESQESSETPKRGRPAKKPAAVAPTPVVVKKPSPGFVVCTVKPGLRISENGQTYKAGDSFETTAERARQLKHVVTSEDANKDAKIGENRMISEGSPVILSREV